MTCGSDATFTGLCSRGVILAFNWMAFLRLPSMSQGCALFARKPQNGSGDAVADVPGARAGDLLLSDCDCAPQSTCVSWNFGFVRRRRN